MFFKSSNSGEYRNEDYEANPAPSRPVAAPVAQPVNSMLHPNNNYYNDGNANFLPTPRPSNGGSSQFNVEVCGPESWKICSGYTCMSWWCCCFQVAQLVERLRDVNGIQKIFPNSYSWIVGIYLFCSLIAFILAIVYNSILIFFILYTIFIVTAQIRSATREYYNIQGSFFCDLCTSFWCHP